jgi:hypothetical protein
MSESRTEDELRARIAELRAACGIPDGGGYLLHGHDTRSTFIMERSIGLDFGASMASRGLLARGGSWRRSARPTARFSLRPRGPWAAFRTRMEISASRASASKSPRIPVTCRPWQTALGTLQPAGQGQKPRRRVIARDRLAAAHAEALAEFGELVSWHVETFSRGSPGPNRLEKTVTKPRKKLFSWKCHAILDRSPRRRRRSDLRSRPAPRRIDIRANSPGFLRADQRSSGPPRRYCRSRQSLRWPVLQVRAVVPEAVRVAVWRWCRRYGGPIV